ncbi:MAG: efflux transporter periplasmic adaptor subunit [Chthoniobacteraceae bacterium]|nr:efflux transporter periplasmic adaptor subunit [Chthoniobacteraceae bacterium]
MNASTNDFVTHANRGDGRDEKSAHDPTVSHNRRDTREPSPPHLGKLMAGVVVILAIGVGAGLMPRLHKKALVVNDTRELATLSVSVVNPTPAKAAPPLLLSGELKAMAEAVIYARTSGYVRRYLVDIGAKVEAGQLLAELDTPDLDRELAQARAELKRSQAGRQMSETTAKRWSQLLGTKAVSPQESEEKQSDVELKRATVESADAKVQQLEEVQRFAKITAPFAGTVTARHLDVGQLVAAGTENELYRLAQTEKMRVFVRLPQSYARAVSVGQSAQLLLPEIPNRTFEAKVVRTSGAIDPASRTLLTELEVDNAQKELLAGSYAQVRLSEAKPDAALTLPSNTLFFRAEGALVGIVGADNHVAFRRVNLGRDFGSAVEILSGVEATERVVTNPPDSLVDGAEVRVSSQAK